MKAGILAALMILILCGAVSGKPSKGLAFINDDFQKALKQGRQHNLPLFVDVWAPW